MFKASIALVVLAFLTLAYGWVRGIDPLLYGSIAFSALAGLALMRSTVQDRRKHPELTRSGRKSAMQLRDRDRRNLADLRNELSGLKGEISAVEEQDVRRRPLKPFGESAEDQEVEVRRPARDRAVSLEEKVRRPEPRPATGPADADDFRSRLSAVLGEGGAPAPRETDFFDEEPAPRPRPQTARPKPAARRPEPRPAPRRRPEAAPEDDDIGSDWIRIDDVPRIARATQKGGGYALPEPAPVESPKRRSASAAAAKTTKRSPAAKEGAPAKAPAKKPASPRPKPKA